MVGIGITTYKRTHLLDECLRQINLLTTGNYKVYVAVDDIENRKGIAKKKNECLHHLQDCEYIFLFDDDCHPIMPDWNDFFVQAHKVSHQHHFLFNNDDLHKTKGISIHSQGKDQIQLIHHHNSGGVFMFFTKRCIDLVGGFYDKYSFYGFEHIGMSLRIHNSGFGLTEEAFLTVEHTDKYLYAYDYNHKHSISSLSEEEKTYHKNINCKILEEDIRRTFHPITYQ